MPWGRRAPAGDDARARRVGVVVLALLCVVVAATAGPWEPAQRATGGFDLPLPVASVAPEPAPPDAERQPLELAETDPGLAWIGRTLWLLAIAVALTLLVRWALRHGRAARTPPPDATDAGGTEALTAMDDVAPDARTLRAGAQLAADHLRARVPPRDAVIAAWVALEDAAAQSGMPRAASATPTEFTLQVLDRTPADPAAARTLLAVYLRARFDRQPVADDDVRVAAGAARDLLATLGDRDTPAPGVVGPGTGGPR